MFSERSMRIAGVALAVALLGGTPVLAETLATVGVRQISRERVEKENAAALAAVEQARYDALKEGLDSLINEALLELEGEARGVSVEDLIKVEIRDKVTGPTEEEIQTVYQEAQEQLEGQPLEDVRGQIVDYLSQVKTAERQQAFLAELRAKYPTTVELRPPTYDIEVGSRVMGPPDAPITIVEFSDYECPFCKRAEASVQQVLEAYKGKVRFSYRDFPLAFHPNARTAAEAAHCANAQGKFWEYHSKLMGDAELTESGLKAAAVEVGMDEAVFGKCLADGTYRSEIDKDIAAAAAAGINGTPAFFINGRKIDGAQPFEAFQEIIDDELSRSGAGA